MQCLAAPKIMQYVGVDFTKCVHDQFLEHSKILVAKVKVTLTTYARLKNERLREAYVQLLMTQNCYDANSLQKSLYTQYNLHQNPNR